MGSTVVVVVVGGVVFVCVCVCECVCLIWCLSHRLGYTLLCSLQPRCGGPKIQETCDLDYVRGVRETLDSEVVLINI
jgi:hypothetical protein